MAKAAPWWRGGVVYQIYPRSFADSTGDGVGDLPGILSRLDYLEWLGIDGIWLNPTFPSPNADWGYDVADYCSVHPDLGTLADLDRLVTEAGARGIRVLLDFVPNHTSDRHPWFLESRASRDSPGRDRYVWADPGPAGGPPNNWQSVFGGPAWTFDERTRQYYLHIFLPRQPDLNWWNGKVRDEFDQIMRFWLDRGVAGFRIDVAHRIVTAADLRDAPPEAPHPPADIAELHAVLRRWRRLADGYDPRRVLVGETWVLDLEDWARFYGSGEDELDLAFNFPFVLAPFDAAALADVVATTEAVIPPAAWPAWTLSNHDLVRFPTRWCYEDEAKARAALLLLFTLRGTPFLYYGDELAMPQTRVAGERARDGAGRDGARTPMHWSGEAGAGFTRAGVEPWLPLGDHRARNVDDQRRDPGSVLSLCRDLIALRRESPDLREGGYERVESAAGTWAWGRGEGTLVALNLSDNAASLDAVTGTIALATDRARDGERVRGRLELRRWEGVVVA